MTSVYIRRATPDDAEALSAIWEIICAERVYTAVSQPFSPEQERAYIVIVHLLVKLGYNVGGNPFLREEERCGYSFVCPQ